MTTGRINQVTIVTGRASERSHRQAHPEGTELLPGRDAGTDPTSGCNHVEARRPRQVQAIRLPPLDFSRSGPPQIPRRAREGLLRSATCAPRVEVPSRPSRSPTEADTGFGGPPNVWRITLAIGHQSTDSVNARGRGATGLRSLNTAHSRLSREGQLDCVRWSSVNHPLGRS